ncbi:MAG TPA: HAMP domain-containing sensor histidine kinase [Mycobacteriales bacterium]
MNLTVANVAWAMLWSAVAAIAVWFALLPVRRRTLLGVVTCVVLTGTAASLGAMLSAIHAMLLPTSELVTVVVLTVVAGVIATVAAGAAARRLAHDNRLLHTAVADLAAGRVPTTDGRPLTAELDQLRHDLAATARSLSETRDRERALEAARRELVSWVSHDLRTPLAGLRAIAEALEDGLADDPSAYYKQISASVDRVNNMVDDLFDLSRIQAGHTRTADEPVSFDDLASDVIVALAPLARARGVTLRGTPAGTAFVRGDAAQLDRAVTNLVANAIRHTPDGGTVTIAVSRARDCAEISVSDECGGIPESDLARVFDVGFRGESARPPHDDGSAGAGLGLAIVRGVIEAHHGAVSVANHGCGCTFRLAVPFDAHSRRAGPHGR